MIKRINKYLLENYPLIWNTKIAWMLLILLGVHIVFYFAGFFSLTDLKQLQNQDFFMKYILGRGLWIGILVSILIFILWLNNYFKQNAFKSFYPKSNPSLFAEFVIIFLICFLNISFYISYTEGLRQRVSNFITMEQLKHEVDIVNKGAAFTLQGNYDYGHSNRCISVPVFDSLVSEDEVLKLYIERIVNNPYRDSEWKNVNPKDYLLYRDSLPQPFYVNYEYTDLLAKHFPNRVRYLNKTKDTVYNESALNSIYNYCKHALLLIADKNTNFESIEKHSIIDDLANVLDNSQRCIEKEAIYYALYCFDLLSNNKKAEIEKLLNEFSTIAEKYKVSYRFKDKNWIDYVYNPPYYFVEYNLSSERKYDNRNDVYFEKDHILSLNLNLVMVNLIKSKSNVISIEKVLTLLYIALFFSIFIYAFRITSLRIWLMSIVGAIVMVFVFLAIFFLANTIDYIGLREDVWLIYQCLLFILFCWIFIAICLKKAKLKKFAGMVLNWGIVSFSAIFPIIIFGYMEYTENFHHYKISKYPPLYQWIENHIIEIGFFNVLLFLLFLFLITPVIKKWKSLPN